MSLHFSMDGTVPPGGFRFKVPESGRWIEAPQTMLQLQNAVLAHYRANNFPIPVDLFQQIETQLCEMLPPEYCTSETTASRFSIRPLSFAEAIRGTATLADWMIHGAKKVSTEEATARARICVQLCPFNQAYEGCTTCSSNQMRNLAESIVGTGVTGMESQLNICHVCGCSLKAKIWLDKDVLNRHLSDEQKEKLPGYCWLKKE